MFPDSPLRWLSLITAALVFALAAAVTVVSAREGEKRAALRSAWLAMLLPVPFLLAGLVPFPGQDLVAGALVTTAGVAGLLLFMPGGWRGSDDDAPPVRIDERDTMFARNRLQPGSERATAYYRQHPEHWAADERFRRQPGLLQPGTIHYDRVAFAAADAGFTSVAAFRSLLDRPPPPQTPFSIPATQAARFIKGWAKKLGATTVGVTRLRDYHLYSALGRNEPYGAPVQREHEFAIAITVEMDKAMVDCAPLAPTVMESARQYLNAGAIAVQLAECIRALGHPARAHIDGKYRVVCPLVARDAGLGEIGRAGLLVTPELGPRVRLTVVTTSLPLVCDERRRDDSIVDFCTHCLKCAEVCPARAIPFGPRREIDGVKRWQIDSEACFTFWCASGTDCGRCIRVCPYAHPRGWLHGLVRAGIRTAPRFRRFALRMDDFLYGRRPPPAPVPEWMADIAGTDRSPRQEP